MRWNNKWIIGVMVVVCTCACDRKDPAPGPEEVPAGQSGAIPSDFLQFYTRFHADSVFQMSRIAFPLEGLPAERDSASDAGSFRWQASEWVLHQPLNNDEERYDQSFDVLGDGLIVETIRHRQVSLVMQRRFAEMAGGWHLIYYIEMQPMD